MIGLIGIYLLVGFFVAFGCRKFISTLVGIDAVTVTLAYFFCWPVLIGIRFIMYVIYGDLGKVLGNGTE